ncbi:MAG: transglutaminase protein [Microbacteriaceae bacterium]|nr:transglutaminase protein [Microbacteriaceae bacterium]
MTTATASVSRVRLAGKALTATVWVDVAVLTVLNALAIAGFEPAFGPYDYLVAGIAGLVVGTVAALAGVLLRLGVLWTVILAIAAYFLFGSAVTMPAQAIGGVIPSGTSLAGLVQGAVFGWADIVTLQTPVEAPAYIAVVPYFATWLAALLCVSLACRWLPRRPRTPLRAAVLLVPPVVLYVAGILLGTAEPYLAALRGVAFAAIALVWLGWRRRRDGSMAITVDGPARRRKVVGVAIVVLGGVAIGAVGGYLAGPAAAQRFVLRQQITPPFDPLQYPSPLAGFRNYTKKLEKTDLFTVTGLQDGQRIRLATMDSYDGQVWSVASPKTQTSDSGAFELLGRTIPKPPLALAGPSSTLTVTIDGYDDVWLPDALYPDTLDFDAFTGTDPTTTIRVNPSTSTAAVTSGVSKGLKYTLRVTTPDIPNDKKLATVPAAKLEEPPVSNVPDVVKAKALEYAGSAKTAIQQLRNVERTLKTTGYLSHGLASDPVPSLAGAGADRMTTLFTKEPMVGDEEQYSSAFALMAKSLGFDTRVVMGFAPKVTKGTTSVEVTGKDVTAWDEVAFRGVGWVPFYPTPTRTDAPQEQTTKPKIEPQPQVRQPPTTTKNQGDLLTPVKISNKNPPDKGAGFQLPAWAYWVAGIIGIPLLLYFVPLLVVALLRRRRRSVRRETGSADSRVAGAWDELVDRLVELGLPVPDRATRVQTARALERQGAEQGVQLPDDGLEPMARSVDDVVFSGREVDDGAVQGAWQASDETTDAALASAGWLRRRVAALRLRRRSRPRPSAARGARRTVAQARANL